VVKSHTSHAEKGVGQKTPKKQMPVMWQDYSTSSADGSLVA